MACVQRSCLPARSPFRSPRRGIGSEVRFYERSRCGDLVPLREGTSNSATNATFCGDQVSGASVSRPCLGSGPRSAAQHSLWRSHAKATSGDVQSGTGSTLDCERPHRIATQLSLVLGSNRTQPSSFSSGALLACDAPLQELRAPGEIHRRSRLASQFPLDSQADVYTTVVHIVSSLVRGARSSQELRALSFPHLVIWQLGEERFDRQPHVGERGFCHVTH